MPICLNPKKRFNISLKSDMEAPDHSRPAFIFRHPNGERWMEFADAGEKVAEAKGGREALTRIHDALRILLVGWEHITTDDPEIAEAFGVTANGSPAVLPYDSAKLAKVLDAKESKELLQAVLAAVQPSETEMGN